MRKTELGEKSETKDEEEGQWVRDWKGIKQSYRYIFKNNQ